MRAPRTSLATVGFAILLLAVDFSLIRAAFDPRPWSFFPFFFMPMFNIVLIALFRLRKPERRTPGAVGFLFVGSAATLALFAFCVVAPNMALDLIRITGEPIAGMFMNGFARTFGNAVMRVWVEVLSVLCEFLLPMALLCLPPLLVAVGGGWLARRVWSARPIMAAGLGSHPTLGSRR